MTTKTKACWPSQSEVHQAFPGHDQSFPKLISLLLSFQIAFPAAIPLISWVGLSWEAFPNPSFIILAMLFQALANWLLAFPNLKLPTKQNLMLKIAAANRVGSCNTHTHTMYTPTPRTLCSLLTFSWPSASHLAWDPLQNYLALGCLEKTLWSTK